MGNNSVISPSSVGTGQQVTQVSLAQIRTDGGTQPRMQVDEEHVSRLAQAVLDGDRLPPVVVFYDGTDYWLADGFHRYHAVEHLGQDTIAAEVRQGVRWDAIEHAIEANLHHGLPLSLADRKRAAQTLLTSDTWMQKSNREIGRKCGLSHNTINALRAEQTGQFDQSVLRVVHVGNDIRTYNTANIGHASPLVSKQELLQRRFQSPSHADPSPIVPDDEPVPEAAAAEEVQEQDPLASVADHHTAIHYEEEPLLVLTSDAVTGSPAGRATAYHEVAHTTQPTLEGVVDSAPLPVKGVAQGQVWQLGRHVLYCGDSASSQFIDLATQAHAVFAFADPPYNAHVAEWDMHFIWQHDYLAEIAPIVAVTPGISAIKDFMCHTAMPYKWSMSYWIDNGMTRGALGFGNWMYVALFAQGSLYRNAQDLAHVHAEDMERISITGGDRDPLKHKGRKPIEMISHMVKLFTLPGTTVIDPFLGSGTTLIACAQSGRICMGAEINPEYCEAIIRRWERLTGGKAEMVG